MQYAFIAHAKKDRPRVRRLVDELQDKGICCLLDRPGQLPGQDWQDVIQRSIPRGLYFLVCLSSANDLRAELALAVGELCRNPEDRSWFIPVKLSHGPIPEASIGPGESLKSLKWIDLNQNWRSGIAEIIKRFNTGPVTATSPIDDYFSTDYATALNRLDSHSLAHRIQAIVSLEQIARLSPMAHWSIMQKIACFVRNQSRKKLHYSYEELFFQRPADDILAALNALRTRHPDRVEEPLDFSEMFLAEADFSCGKYRGASFQYSILIEASFEEADIERANFQRVRLELADLRGAHGPKACFSGANLECADLDNAVLCSAEMIDASLNNARFRGADLNGVQFCGASLEGADFSGADLTGANFMSANLKGAVFNDAELHRTSWGNAVLPETLRPADDSNVSENHQEAVAEFDDHGDGF